MTTTGFRQRRIGSVTCVGSGRVGGKAHNILRLIDTFKGQNLARVPGTVILAKDVVDTFNGDVDTTKEFLTGIQLRTGPVAVRSSGLSEDGKLNCPGVFDTTFTMLDPRDPLRLAFAVNQVVKSDCSRRATAYIGRNGLEKGMGLVIQSVVGSTFLGGSMFGPVFSGVLDTSSVNGNNTMTLSVVLGLGTVAVGGIRSSNLVILPKGKLLSKTPEIIVHQTYGELLDTSLEGKLTKVELEELLRLLRFSSLNDAIRHFLNRYTIPLHLLSTASESQFDGSPVDIEFAVSASTGAKRLYLLQARKSNMQQVVNENYPEKVEARKTVSLSRTVLGASTVETTIVVDVQSNDYLTDAGNGFPALRKLDSLGKKYILLIPPEATSSQHENVPLSELHNLAFLVEKLTNEQVHDIGLTGIDHISRRAHELGVGYMEGFVSLSLLSSSSQLDASIPGLSIFHGNFGAAVCSATNRGILYVK